MFFHGLVICTSSLVTCLFMYFAISNWTIFFLFHFESSLYVQDTSPLSDMLFANTSSNLCLSLYPHKWMLQKKKNKWMLHKTKDFNFDEVQLVKFSSIDFTFCVKSIISLLSPESWGFSLSLFFSWNCYCVGFILQSVVHLEINLHKLWVSVETPFFVFCLLMPSNLFWKD